MNKQRGWRFEESTMTIRSVPGNHWIASMDSWDGAVDNNANAKLIALAPEMYEALRYLLNVAEEEGWSEFVLGDARAILERIDG